MCCLPAWQAEDKMQEKTLIQLAQQVAGYVVLQQRTDGAGSVHHLRSEPNPRKVVKKAQLEPMGFSAGLSIEFDNNMVVLVVQSLLSGSVSRCCVLARPHAFEHGEWVELLDSDQVSHNFSGTELHVLREALRNKSGGKYEFGRTRC